MTINTLYMKQGKITGRRGSLKLFSLLFSRVMAILLLFDERRCYVAVFVSLNGKRKVLLVVRAGVDIP